MFYEEKDRIIKVVFYEVEINGEKCHEAAIFRESGVTFESKENGIDALLKIAKTKKLKNMKELESSNYYEVLKENKLKEKYPGLYKIVKEDDEAYSKSIKKDEDELEQENETKKKHVSSENNNSNETHSEDEDDFDEDLDEFDALKNVFKKFKVKNFKARVGLIALTGAIVFGGFTLVKKAVNGIKGLFTPKTTIEQPKEETVIPTTEIKDEAVDVNELPEETIPTYNTVNDILTKAEINKTKTNVISKVWDYLSNYNSTISSKHTDKNTTTKLAHTWDEAMVYYLAYNNISKDEANKIFDNYYIPVDTFKYAYNAGSNQDILAYKVITEPTNKEILIKTEVGKNFYKKYENMIINYNKSENNIETRQKLIEDFYKEVRLDYPLDKDAATVESYKLSVIPIIKAFNELTENIESEHTLTTEEKNYIKNIGKFSQIKEKITELSTSVHTYSVAKQALEEYETDEYLYEDIKEVAENELTSKNAYYISEEERDISNHEVFKKNEEVKVEETTKNEQIQETTSTKKTTSTQTQATQTTTPTYDNSDLYTGVIEDTETEDVIPDWMLEENDQEQEEITEEKHKKKKKKAKKEEAKTEPIEIEIYEVEPDTPINDNQTVNENIDNEYKTETGNLDSSVTNVTNDVVDISITDELPDPNNNDTIPNNSVDYEAVAEKIVEDMANNPTSSDNITYQYILR